MNAEKYKRLKQIQFIEQQHRRMEMKKKEKKAALVIEKYMYK